MEDNCIIGSENRKINSYSNLLKSIDFTNTNELNCNDLSVEVLNILNKEHLKYIQ